MIELEHVGKRYDGGAPVLSDVSLTLAEGEFCILTGARGAGKTTLLKIIALSEPPSTGRLRLFGADPAALDRDARAALRRRIGILFQQCWLVEELSVRDNVALPLVIAGTPEREVGDNVDELLAWIGLAERRQARAATLSAGERQLVAIARAIVGRPALLIADEPTAAGGEDIAPLLVSVLEQLNRLGTTVLLTGQELGFADRLAHRRLHLHQGMLSGADNAPMR